jgi:hypothetical protein
MLPGGSSPAGEKSAVMIIRAAGGKEINSRLQLKMLMRKTGSRKCRRVPNKYGKPVSFSCIIA